MTMKVLMVVYDHDTVGGSQTVMKRDLEVLRGEPGVLASVIARYPVAREPEKGFVHVKGMNSDFTSGHNGGREISALVRREKPDLVHFHATTVFGDPKEMLYLSRDIPMVITVYNHYLSCPKPSQDRMLNGSDVCMRRMDLGCLYAQHVRGCVGCGTIGRIRRYIAILKNRPLHREAAQLVVINDYLKNEVVRAGIGPANISVVSPSLAQGRDMRPRKRVATDVPEVLFVGRIHRLKGVQYLLEASLRMNVKHKIVVVGDGPFLPELKDLAQSLGIAGRVEFRGEVSESVRISCLEKAVVLAVPSVWPETFGMVGLEAIQMGLPVVAHNVGGMPSWCLDGENGFLVSPKDVRMLAEKLDRITGDPVLAYSMGKRGQQIARDRFSQEVHRAHLMAAYSRALENFRCAEQRVS